LMKDCINHRTRPWPSRWGTKSGTSCRRFPSIQLAGVPINHCSRMLRGIIPWFNYGINGIYPGLNSGRIPSGPPPRGLAQLGLSIRRVGGTPHTQQVSGLIIKFCPRPPGAFAPHPRRPELLYTPPVQLIALVEEKTLNQESAKCAVSGTIIARCARTPAATASAQNSPTVDRVGEGR
jgi:hypothetical protein